MKRLWPQDTSHANTDSEEDQYSVGFKVTSCLGQMALHVNGVELTISCHHTHRLKIKMTPLPLTRTVDVHEQEEPMKYLVSVEITPNTKHKRGNDHTAQVDTQCRCKDT